MLENLADKRIILASKSPRRQELLKGLDIDFTVKTREVDESYPSHLDPTEIPEFLALKKADAFEDLLQEDTIILTSDTIVIHDNRVLEKPSTAKEGKEMIELLSDSSHMVVTGVCIRTLGKSISFSDETTVKFMKISATEIDYYIEKYQPYDKAGAYGVQEWIGYIGIERLKGSYYTVMGLPVHKVYQALKTL